MTRVKMQETAHIKPRKTAKGSFSQTRSQMRSL